MKKFVYLVFILIISCKDNPQHSQYEFTTIFESSKGTETATYQETIAFYNALADQYASITIDSIGQTDIGLPLHLVTYTPNNINKDTNNTCKLLINNGIHPGESDGIDATMMLFRDLAQEQITPPKNTIICAIPIYNIGGSLNRNTGTRTNQNGPKSYGFRGNGRNFDLNRDFIKSDTKNALAFAQLYHQVQPDVFIDNHVSNGADYQYTITHLFTQHNKLGGPSGTYLHKTLMPSLEQDLLTKGYPITPYVNVWGKTPEQGWSQFMDYPRFSTGYTTLFGSLGLMVETHMLKPYKDRVTQTYALMESMIALIDKDAAQIKQLRAKQLNHVNDLKEYALDWNIDSTKVTKLQFKGYEARYIPSKVTQQNRLFYDRTKPYTKNIDYYNHMQPKCTVKVPKAYIIPKQWSKVIELLQLNQVQLHPLKKDTIITIEAYRIAAYKTRNSVFEGHYLHYNTRVESQQTTLTFSKGDYIAYLTPYTKRYLLETLEPNGPDSFFNWNYFDSILQQKEHFSAYVFEDKAYEILSTQPELKRAFEEKRKNNSAFANNSHAQLDWIHKQSMHYESSHLRYPIYRILY